MLLIDQFLMLNICDFENGSWRVLYREGTNFHGVNFRVLGETASMLNFRVYKFSWVYRGCQRFSRN